MAVAHSVWRSASWDLWPPCDEDGAKPSGCHAIPGAAERIACRQIELRTDVQVIPHLDAHDLPKRDGMRVVRGMQRNEPECTAIRIQLDPLRREVRDTAGVHCGSDGDRSCSLKRGSGALEALLSGPSAGVEAEYCHTTDHGDDEERGEGLARVERHEHKTADEYQARRETTTRTLLSALANRASREVEERSQQERSEDPRRHVAGARDGDNREVL